MTIEKCKQLCFQDSDYVYAGVESKSECFCGYSKPPSSERAHQYECDQMCKGDPSEVCGGHWRINVHQRLSTG